MQAEIIGTKFVLNKVKIAPQKIKQRQTWTIKGKFAYLTIKTPKIDASDIKTKILLLFTTQGCNSETQAPMVKAQISGKMISFSLLNSRLS